MPAIKASASNSVSERHAGSQEKNATRENSRGAGTSQSRQFRLLKPGFVVLCALVRTTLEPLLATGRPCVPHAHRLAWLTKVKRKLPCRQGVPHQALGFVLTVGRFIRSFRSRVLRESNRFMAEHVELLEAAIRLRALQLR